MSVLLFIPFLSPTWEWDSSLVSSIQVKAVSGSKYGLVVEFIKMAPKDIDTLEEDDICVKV